MLDIFNNDPFSVVALTARVNNEPFVPGQIGAAGYFQSEGVNVLNLAIARGERETLRLVGPTPRGGPGETRTFGEGDLVNLSIPHFQREDSILADEVQGRRTFGGVGDNTDEMETIAARLTYKVRQHLRDFDLTVEHQRVGAIKGIVTNKSGGVMLNTYTAFDIPVPTPITLNLSNADLDLRKLGEDIQYRFEDIVESGYEGVDCWMGRTAFQTFMGHKYNREVARILQDRAALTGKSNTDEVDLYGVNWRRYRTGQRAEAANGGAGFIGPNEVRFVPRVLGADAFLTRYGPADYEETVNTEGLPRYLKQYPMLNGKGRNLEVQMNVINVCTRPDWLVAGTLT